MGSPHSAEEVYTCVNCKHPYWEHGEDKACLFGPGTKYASKYLGYPPPDEYEKTMNDLREQERQIDAQIEKLEEQKKKLQLKQQELYQFCCHIDGQGKSIVEGGFFGSSCPRCYDSDY